MRNTVIAISALVICAAIGFVSGFGAGGGFIPEARAVSDQQEAMIIFNIGKAEQMKKPITFKTEQTFKPRRYFIVAWQWDNKIGDFGYSVVDSKYPTREELIEFVKDKHKISGAIITFITEVKQADFNQYFNK